MGGYETEGILLDHRGHPLVVDSTATHGFPGPESRFGSTALTPVHHLSSMPFIHLSICVLHNFLRLSCLLLPEPLNLVQASLPYHLEYRHSFLFVLIVPSTVLPRVPSKSPLLKSLPSFTVFFIALGLSPCSFSVSCCWACPVPAVFVPCIGCYLCLECVPLVPFAPLVPSALKPASK